MRRRWKRTRRCGASSGGTRANPTRRSCGVWRRRPGWRHRRGRIWLGSTGRGKNKKTSNKEWKSPQDPDAKVAKMKDGRTHMAHKAEHGVDMDTGAIVSVTVQDASDGDTATLPETLIMAAEQVELVQPDGPGVEEVVADKGVPQRRDSGGTRRGRGSESRIGAGARPALLAGQEDGRDAAGEACCAEGFVCEPPACPRAAGSSPATLPGRGGGAYFRAHV